MPETTDKNEDIHYSHQIVSATLVRLESSSVAAGCRGSAQRRRDGETGLRDQCGKAIDKAGEARASAVVVDSKRRRSICHEPYVKLLREERMNFVLGVKPGSHTETFAW